MRKSLLFIFSLISLSAFSQTNWIKEHAVWHFRFTNISYSGTGYVKVWDSGDTTIQNKVCKKLKAVKHSFEHINPQGDIQEYITNYFGGIVYYSNDTVYHWDQDHFSVLFDFSAQVNDQWILQTGGMPLPSCNDTSVCIVQSVGSVNIGGQIYPELYLGYGLNAGFHVSGKVNARFGAALDYLFPRERWCDTLGFFDADELTFLCFEDDSLYYNPTGGACEYYLGLDESKLTQVSVFPNPSSGKIELLSDVPLKQIKVLNVLGAVLREVDTELTLKEIDLSELPHGTYYLNIENSNGEHVIKPIQLSDR